MSKPSAFQAYNDRKNSLRAMIANRTQKEIDEFPQTFKDELHAYNISGPNGKVIGVEHHTDFLRKSEPEPESPPKQYITIGDKKIILSGINVSYKGKMIDKVICESLQQCGTVRNMCRYCGNEFSIHISQYCPLVQAVRYCT